MADKQIPSVFAHRGVSAEFAENTLDAFAAASERGADGVELDVRRTADGRLAVHHDARLADGRVIVETPSSELPDEVPVLEAALDACGDLVVNIELKNLPGEPDFDPESHLADLTVDIVRRRERTDQVIISSFNFADITKAQRLDADIATGWLVLDMVDITAMVASVVDGGHRALHTPAARTSAAIVQAAHESGVQVRAWTVDDPALVTELAELGVDALITNDPAATRSTLLAWARPG